jgi:hypothetical protein
MTLPEQISCDLFSKNTTDIAIDHLIDDIEQYSFNDPCINQGDNKIVLYFESTTDLNPQITIIIEVDKTNKNFTIIANTEFWRYLPITGNWSEILTHIRNITHGTRRKRNLE